VVGAGQRVQNNFLPVLRALRDHFTVVGVHARTAARLLPVAEQWAVPAVAELVGPELRTADVVAISIPTSQNAPVLRALLPHAARLSLVIDTPVASDIRELAATAPLLAQFKRVLVAEDYMNRPAFALARQAVAQGLIGTPLALTLNNIGYLYHGLALIRSFNQFKPALRTWRRKIDSSAIMVGYQFRNGYKACVIGPYRRGTIGGLTLEGSAGVITQSADDLPRASARRPVHLLAPRHTGGQLSGYAIEAGTKSLELYPAELTAMREMNFADKSDLNLQRGCGLATIFRALLGKDDPATRLNLAYGPNNAFYDAFVSRLAGRGVLPIDPLTWFGRDVMDVMPLAASWRRMRPTA